jgi:hypothetical protein
VARFAAERKRVYSLWRSVIVRSSKGCDAMESAFELGLYTFGDLMPDTPTAKAIGARQRLADILAAARLADEAGLDVFAVGEHHRLDMAVSATPVVLAAIAAGTRRIRLASAVTILSTADPVRVFEDFATVDLISGGRAELIAGRGIFTESFPLFGCDLADYDDLFAEKLDLLLTPQTETTCPSAPGAERPDGSEIPQNPGFFKVAFSSFQGGAAVLTLVCQQHLAKGSTPDPHGGE